MSDEVVTGDVSEDASGEVIEQRAKQPIQHVDSGRNYRKVREGYVVSDKMSKTIVVELEDRKKHALYGKVLRSTNKVKAHDEENSANIGDRVIIMETRPQSATKRWRLARIVERAK